MKWNPTSLFPTKYPNIKQNDRIVFNNQGVSVPDTPEFQDPGMYFISTTFEPYGEFQGFLRFAGHRLDFKDSTLITQFGNQQTTPQHLSWYAHQSITDPLALTRELTYRGHPACLVYSPENRLLVLSWYCDVTEKTHILKQHVDLPESDIEKAINRLPYRCHP